MLSESQLIENGNTVQKLLYVNYKINYKSNTEFSQGKRIEEKIENYV